MIDFNVSACQPSIGRESVLSICEVSLERRLFARLGHQMSSDVRSKLIAGFSGQRSAVSGIPRRRLINTSALIVTNAPPHQWNQPLYLVPMASWIFAVSTYCWNLVTFPSLTSQTWQTCASMLLPVALYVPL